METDGIISISQDKLRSDEDLQQLAEYSSQMLLVLQVGPHLSQELRQQELSEDQADISLSSEREETVFLLHKYSKQEHESVSEMRHQDIRLMLLVLETLSDFVFQQELQPTLFLFLMLQEMLDGRVLLRRLILSMLPESLARMEAVDI